MSIITTNNINSTCNCGTLLCMYKEDIATMIPCNHLIHSRCISKINLETGECPICNQILTGVFTYTEVKNMIKKNNFTYYQNYIDMNAVKNKSKYGKVNYFNLLKRSLPLTFSVTQLLNFNSFEEGIKLTDVLLKKLRLDVTVVNEHKLVDTNKVFISNHSNWTDSIIILNKFKCGFLTSTVIDKIWYTKQMSKHIPLVKVDRSNKNSNTVDKIKDFLKTNKSVCLFPEGVMTHPKTLIKFRTGAFNVGYPIQPIVISYCPYVYNEDSTKAMLKLFSQDKIKVTVTVLDMEYPPFNAEKIESIRDKMACAGNFVLSNVSNKDIKERK
jgi:1-acyl-sn-glycerol-3-phosphate acyltransferase